MARKSSGIAKRSHKEALVGKGKSPTISGRNLLQNQSLQGRRYKALMIEEGLGRFIPVFLLKVAVRQPAWQVRVAQGVSEGTIVTFESCVHSRNT